MKLMDFLYTPDRLKTLEELERSKPLPLTLLGAWGLFLVLTLLVIARVWVMR